MPIPDYQTIMLPLLKFAADKKEHSKQESIEHISDLFKLSEEEKKELLPSGKQRIISNRIGWARTYMKKAGLLESPRRGYFKITRKGLDVLSKQPSEINVKFLEQFPEFIEFRTIKKEGNEDFDKKLLITNQQTPQETLEYGYQKIRSELAQDLLDLVKKASPDFFEMLVVDLIVKMGYGGSRKDAGERIGQRGDGGVDGIIKEDKLGLDVIYIQAKRWDATVGRPEIQKFAGALQGHHATKGIFITTSNFSKEALEFAKTIGIRIILIGGEYLSQLMIDHDVGVSISETYDVKQLNRDYFDEE